MGYSERVCMLCGISFNIGRMRKHDEPETNAWDSSGQVGSFCSIDDDFEDDAECQDVARNGTDDKEHIAGPNCRARYQGYSGWNIAADEMRERTWIQCLHSKGNDWTPESDDEDFEIAAKDCFVTGTSKSGVYEFDAHGFQPVRHGVAECLISTSVEDTDVPWGLPMHPACYQIFKRMSTHRFGTVDIDGLWQLRNTHGDYPRFVDLEEREDVTLVGEQWYDPVPGTEYLAANPGDVPGLERLLDTCEEPESDTVFEQRPDSSPSARDPFQLLSPELRMILLDYLERQDVANLRLTSKIFSQLPRSYFRELIRKEMPWVWEIDDLQPGGKAKHGVDWYSLWCKLTVADGGDCSDEVDRSNGVEPAVDREELDIKGLRNRRMIWRDINMVLDMMAEKKDKQKE